jgi:DNA modification methylase
MSDIKWTTERRHVSDLTPAGYNPRKISDKERADLRASIEENGEVEPVVINRDNQLIGGHQRVGIYADMSIDEIDVRVPSRQLSVEEEIHLNLRLNKNTGSWDNEKLFDLGVETLLDVGFGDEELSEIWDNVETVDDEFNEKKAVEEAKTSKIKVGEIYKLGEHRLMCGDSMAAADVKKMMGGELAEVIYCDPPYNIGLDYSKGVSTGGKYNNAGVLNDNKTEKGYDEFLSATMENAMENAHYFYWCDEKYIGMVQELYRILGIENKRVCLWIKNNFNMTPQIAFNKAYEPCVYGTIGRPYLNKNYRNLTEVMNKDVQCGNQMHDDINDLFNIWLAKRDAGQDYEHPTQKPLTLHERPLKRCSKPGSIVLDLFGGSGSTLMACQQLSRKARLMELNPIFCQVIINRYERNTGNKAEKIS